MSGVDKRFLIIQTAFIGDFVLTTPVINSLNISYGKDNVYVLARPFAKELIENRTIEFNKDKKYLAFFKVLSELKKLKVDFAISPHLSATSALLSFLSGAKDRIGFEESVLPFLFTKRVKKFTTAVESESQRISRILEPLGVVPKSPYIFIDMHYVEKWQKFFKPFVKLKKVVYAPFSNWNTKSYPFWRSILKYVPQDMLFILIGKFENQGYTLGNYNVVDLTNKTNLKDVVAILYLSDFFFGVDNGISHIASALSKRCFVIFGPTIPEFGFFPNFSDYKIIQRSIPCRPCSLHGTKRCPREHFACMRTLDPKYVVEEFLKFAIM